MNFEHEASLGLTSSGFRICTSAADPYAWLRERIAKAPEMFVSNLIELGELYWISLSEYGLSPPEMYTLAAVYSRMIPQDNVWGGTREFFELVLFDRASVLELSSISNEKLPKKSLILSGEQSTAHAFIDVIEDWRFEDASFKLTALARLAPLAQTEPDCLYARLKVVLSSNALTLEDVELWEGPVAIGWSGMRWTGNGFLFSPFPRHGTSPAAVGNEATACLTPPGAHLTSSDGLVATEVSIASANTGATDDDNCSVAKAFCRYTVIEAIYDVCSSCNQGNEIWSEPFSVTQIIVRRCQCNLTEFTDGQEAAFGDDDQWLDSRSAPCADPGWSTSSLGDCYSRSESVIGIREDGEQFFFYDVWNQRVAYAPDKESSTEFLYHEADGMSRQLVCESLSERCFTIAKMQTKQSSRAFENLGCGHGRSQKVRAVKLVPNRHCWQRNPRIKQC